MYDLLLHERLHNCFLTLIFISKVYLGIEETIIKTITPNIVIIHTSPNKIKKRSKYKK